MMDDANRIMIIFDDGEAIRLTNSEIDDWYEMGCKVAEARPDGPPPNPCTIAKRVKARRLESQE